MGQPRMCVASDAGSRHPVSRWPAVPAMHDRQPPWPVGRPEPSQAKVLGLGAETVWLADITYLPTGEGWLYLAAVLDLATREMVG